jgi:uncharacterized Fe-S center protein
METKTFEGVQIALQKIPRLAQRQDSTESQLRDLVAIANHFGLYDAADFVNAAFVDRNVIDTPHG